MTKVEITDLLDELTAENSRLLSELKFTEKLVKLLHNYKKCLINLSTNCKCDPIVNNKYAINLLETEYKSIFKNKDNESKHFDDRIPNDNKSVANESIIPIDLNDNSLDLDQIQEESDDKIIINPCFTSKAMVNINDQTFGDKTRDNLIVKPVITSKNRQRLVFVEKLFNCRFKGCQKSFNSLRRMTFHQMIHTNSSNDCEKQNKSRTKLLTKYNKSESKPDRKHRLHLNETERRRRVNFRQLFANLAKDIPKLNSRKHSPNREILEESILYIKHLEERDTNLITRLNEVSLQNVNKISELQQLSQYISNHTIKTEPTF